MQPQLGVQFRRRDSLRRADGQLGCAEPCGHRAAGMGRARWLCRPGSCTVMPPGALTHCKQLDNLRYKGHLQSAPEAHGRSSDEASYPISRGECGNSTSKHNVKSQFAPSWPLRVLGPLSTVNGRRTGQGRQASRVLRGCVPPAAAAALLDQAASLPPSQCPRAVLACTLFTWSETPQF